MNIIYCMCGSFCNHDKALAALVSLTGEHTVVPAVSEICKKTDTRFGKASDFISRITEVCGRAPISSIDEAENTVTPLKADVLVVSPCTGNTLAKIANGITDTAVTMCVKCQLRNRLPVVIALATNDGLSANLYNIALTLEKKNVYFVPFGQDSPGGKPTSLICDFSRINETIAAAAERRQIQPILF